MSGVRLDRWLWSTRHFKTRTIATDACKRNGVKVNGTAAKPSRLVKLNDELQIQKGALLKTVKVLELLEKRVSASKACECYEDLTPTEMYEQAEEVSKRASEGHCFPSSKGRPSKKQRRELEEFFRKQVDSD